MKRLAWAALVCAAVSCGEVAHADTVVAGPRGREFHTGLLKVPEIYRGLGVTSVSLGDCDGLPDDFDLRDLEVVPPVRDQGSCGSCWSFSKTAALESARRAAGGAALDLSEQELVSCDRNNYGCGGGMLNDAEYQVKTGQALEADFPYKGTDARCKAGLKPAAKATQWVRVKGVTDKAVQCALYKTHTIPWITVSAGGTRWSSPPTGDDAVWPSCGNKSTNHAVGVVGWKTIGGKVYFKMRNSWGKNWGSTAGRPGGEHGYALMKLGCDALGDEVAYPMTDAAPCKPPMPKLPVELLGAPGDELVLAVKPEADAHYQWAVGTNPQPVGTDAAQLMIRAPASGAEEFYRVVATNSCGRGESTVRVKSMSVAGTGEP